MSGAAEPTISVLANRALRRLARAASSRAALRRALLRRARLEAEAAGLEGEELDRRVEAVLDDLAAKGLLDDARFAEARALWLIGRGRSPLQLRAALARQGIAGAMVDDALAAGAERLGDPALAAAVVCARRRRLGPWRAPEERAGEAQRDVARLCRAGFAADIARRVVGAASVEELQAEADAAI